ncbi:MAG: histidine phosphatase family protein [Solirubrobacterales bacterium]
MPTVLLVRHAQASFGSEDYDVLSPTGIEQARVLAAALAGRELNVTRVVSGPARRQIDTAAACAAAGVPEPVIDERWDEYPTEEVLAAHATVAASLDGTGAGGEQITSRQFQQVLDGALAAWVAAGDGGGAGQAWPRFLASRRAALADLVGALGSGETGLAFTSGGTIAALAADLLGHADLLPSLNRVLVNTGITKLAIGRAGISLIGFNDHAHLDAGGGRLLTYR